MYANVIHIGYLALVLSITEHNTTLQCLILLNSKNTITMPNWVKNNVALKGTKQQMTKLFSQVADVKTWEDVENKIGNLELTMRSFLPMPQTFLDWDTTNDMEKFEWFCEGKNQPKEELRKEYENYVRGYKAACEHQTKMYGCVGWYDYNCKTLGCKWDAYLLNLTIADELEKDDIVIVYFYVETAWSRPIAFLQHLATFVNVVVLSDEEANFFNSIVDINNDVEIKDIAQDINKLYKKFEEENKEVDEDEWFDEYEVEETKLKNELEDEFYQYVIDLEIS
jgi:hypothetical protein